MEVHGRTQDAKRLWCLTWENEMDDQTRLHIWNLYQSAWGPVEDAERARLLAESTDEQIIYTDPSSLVEGRAALALRIAASQERFAGAYFRNDTFLAHHDQGLFHWTMYDAGGRVFVKGISFARFGADGRIVLASGFFEAPNRE